MTPTSDILAATLGAFAAVARRVGLMLHQTFMDPTSAFSLLFLASELVLATAVIAGRRLRRRGRLSLRLLARALRPRAEAFGPSGKADLGYFLFNTFSVGLLVGWAILSQTVVSGWALHGLTAAFGPRTAHATGWVAAAFVTVALFVAYDLGYWIDHWLSHRVSWLWEIHKVHHTAETLTPLTVYRVHPLESVKFYNVLALTTGAVDGALSYGLGPHARLHLLGVDAAWMVFGLTVLHLQHSHVWISFPGWLGRLLMSPAHHQVHHSADARHHGRNLGNALAVWDWMAGSLYVPAAERERLRFGVDGEVDPHSVTGALVTPMVEAARALGRSLPSPPRGTPAVDIARPLA